jgi:hypothetical protein
MGSCSVGFALPGRWRWVSGRLLLDRGSGGLRGGGGLGLVFGRFRIGVF